MEASQVLGPSVFDPLEEGTEVNPLGPAAFPLLPLPPSEMARCYTSLGSSARRLCLTLPSFFPLPRVLLFLVSDF